MFLHLYQIFSSLQGHLHFFVHFFFTFMEHFFIGHPIRLTSLTEVGYKIKQNTIMLLRKHQVFNSLQGHLHFFVHFFFTFMGQFFWDTQYIGGQ